MTVYVLYHNNGVIDDQPDGQHHRQQCQQVDGKPHQQHQESGAYQGERHGHRRHDGGTYGTQRQVDHQQNDNHRFGQGQEHLVDGVFYKHAGVVWNVYFQPLGQLPADLRNKVAYLLRHGQRVGPRRLFHTDKNGRLALVPAGGIIILRTQLGRGDIGQPHQCAVGRAHHQLAKIVFTGEIGGGRQVDSRIGTLGLTDTGQVIVGAQHFPYIVCGNTQRRHARRIEPDAHGKYFVANQFSPRNPGYGL